jgi:hypothetical protein
MHTATQLDISMFGIEIGGEPARSEDVFPSWDAKDRFGIVATGPMGTIGASLLIQLAIVAFYDFRPERRGQSIQYPELYVFHVGGPHGDHSYFDFWPQRKEVSVARDARAILTEINDRAITRLAVVDSEPVPVEHRVSELAPALDRLRTAFAYDPSGRVAGGDLVITGLDARTEVNPSMTLDPERALAATTASPPVPGREEERALWREQFARRTDEVPAAERDHVRNRRNSIRTDGCASESYRRVPVERALEMLTGGPERVQDRIRELSGSKIEVESLSSPVTG